jgi:hypothetical protein
MFAAAAIGVADVHLHDLRHTGNQFIANAGANPRELMARMGNDSARAALRQSQDKPKRSSTRKARNRGRHREALSATNNMRVKLVLHWRARQDSNPRPAA